MAIRLLEIEAAIVILHALGKAEREGKVPANADELVERAEELIRHNVAKDADVLTEWFRSSAQGQQTSFAIGQAIADEDAVQERPALFEAMKDGFWAFQTWSDPFKLDEPTPWIEIAPPKDRQSSLRDAAERLGVADLGEVTWSDVSRLEDQRLAQEPYDAQARVAIRLAGIELRSYVSRDVSKPSDASPHIASATGSGYPGYVRELPDGTILKRYPRAPDPPDQPAPGGAGLV